MILDIDSITSVFDFLRDDLNDKSLMRIPIYIVIR